MIKTIFAGAMLLVFVANTTMNVLGYRKGEASKSDIAVSAGMTVFALVAFVF